jgi:phosphoglucomutase
MATSEHAGKPAAASMLADIGSLVAAYYDGVPDPGDPAQRVSFGTSGHRGSSLKTSFNEAHILATTAAIVAHRVSAGVSGPLFMGRDTHGLSEPAFRTALEVLVAAAVDVRIDSADGYTPTPGISHAILRWNREHPQAQADGIVVTPSHNPPEDGGFKYNPPSGGPADATITRSIQDAANELLMTGEAGVGSVARMPWERATHVAKRYDYMGVYVEDLEAVIDLDALAASGLRIGVDPLGGASVAWWGAIAERYELDLTVTNDAIDATFAFMTVDWDGKIRMDPSSPFAMARLIAVADDFDLALGNDADADRFGVVTPGTGLLNPNHYLAVAAEYLFDGARDWDSAAAIGKTLVSSSMLDRVARSLGRRLYEVPVGFKWFVDGLLDGSVGFGGEESAGMSFLRRDGRPWSTDKDGILACLLAAEMTARNERDPGVSYGRLTQRFGAPVYRRIDARATPEQKSALGQLSPDRVAARELAGDAIIATLTQAPGNGESIGGIKVETKNGWFAARPSGTEDLTKLYAESFVDEEHLDLIIEEAQAIIATALGEAAPG